MFSSVVAFGGLAVASAVSTPDLGWDLLATTAPDETKRTCKDATGLPDYLQGLYIVSGPARFEGESWKFQAVFDGFGKLNRFELGGGQVCYTSAWLNTTFSRESEKKGQAVGMLFEETIPPRKCPLLDPICNMKYSPDNDWVNLVQIGDDTCLLTDAPQMLKIDLDTLETQELKVWADDTAPSVGGPVPSWMKKGHVGTSGSAHPTRRPGTNTYVDVISEMGPIPGQKSYVDVYTFDAGKNGPQNRTLIARASSKMTPYLHAFGVTPNYIILPFNHKLNTPNPMHPTLMGSIVEHWDGIRVVDNENTVHTFDTADTFCHVHTVNSWENATGVTLDVGAFQKTPFAKSAQMDIAMFMIKSERDANPVKNVIKRLHMHFSGPLAGSVTSEDFDQLAGSSSDFFRLHPAYIGMPYCIYYATQWWADGENFASMAIVKHDICKGVKTFWQKPNVYPGEPEMIPGPSGAEEDGVVIFVALDGEKETSKLVILDAETFTELEVTELPARIPFTAHGQFVPPLSGRSLVV